jgi:hypothetical protein
MIMPLRECQKTKKRRLKYIKQCTVGPSTSAANRIGHPRRGFWGFATVTPIACHTVSPAERDRSSRRVHALTVSP